MGAFLVKGVVIMAKKSAYTKQRNRIMSYMRRQYKKGIIYDIQIPTEKQLKKQGIKGKDITKLVRELKAITPKTIGQYQTQSFDPETGEIYYNGVETNEPEFVPPTNVSEDDSLFDKTVISFWKMGLESFADGVAYDLLLSWINNTIRTEGEHDTAIMLQEGAEAGHILTWEVVYNKDNAIMYIGYMLDYLPDEGVIYKEETLDKLEYMARLGEALEQDEDWENPS